MIKRLLELPAKPKHSFFLWGARQVGKSSLLKQTYPNEQYIDLLQSDLIYRYSTDPGSFRRELLSLPKGSVVVVDEVQKIPSLLDDVHWLIENLNLKFALCGSSARKLKRNNANLLGGRAERYELFGFTAAELKKQFDLVRIVNQGNLPLHCLSDDPSRLIAGYIADYLKEEVLAESLVRNLPAFNNFLKTAAISDGEFINYSSIASDCGVSSVTVKEYYQILEDTLLGFYLPAYVGRLKRKAKCAPKFYFNNVGIVNYLARRGKLEPGAALFGKAFENLVINEVRAYCQYLALTAELSFWRNKSDIEIDLIVNDFEVAIEIKSATTINNRHLKNLRTLMRNVKVKRAVLVSSDAPMQKTEDGIDIFPFDRFVDVLWAGELF